MTTHLAFTLIASLTVLCASRAASGLSGDLAGQNTASARGDPRSLEPGKPVEREIAEGQTHAYLVRAVQGEFFHIVVSQRGVNVAATLIGPDGKKLFEGDSPDTTQEAEWLTHIAGAGGDYLIEVRAAHGGGPPGRYEITIAEKRRAIPQDEDRLTAQRTFLEANRLFGEKAPESYQKAVEKYKEASAVYRQAGRQVEEAVALNCIGRTYSSLYEYQSGIEFHEAALAAYRRLKDRRSEGFTLHNLGNAHRAISGYEKAIECYQQGLAISREVKDRVGEGNALHNLGNGSLLLSMYDKAIGYYEQALGIRREVKDRIGESRTLSNLGIANDSLSRPEKAIEYYGQALVITREVKDRTEEGSALNNLGGAYYSMGEYEKAIEHYQQALAISREVKDREGEGFTLNNLGVAYDSLGRFEKAAEHYEQALAIIREVSDRAREGSALNNLGAAYYALSRYEKAIDFFEQALVVSREVKDRAGEAKTLTNLGNTYLSLGRNEKAIEHYELALEIQREVKHRAGEATTLNNLGNAYSSLKSYAKSVEYYEKALAIRREVKDRLGEGRTLANLGSAHSALSRYETAVEYYETALLINREVKDRLGEGRTLTRLGDAYYSASRYERATASYEEALAIHREVKDRAGEGMTLGSLMLFWRKQQNPALAILFGKQAVNISQQIRGEIRTLDRESQQSYLESKEETYRTLADILISQGRLAEAEKVLELLKEEEFNRVIRRNGPTDPQIGLTKTEAEAARITDQLALLAGERGLLLAKTENKTATDAERQRLDLIEARITEANKKIRLVLTEVAKASAGEGMMTQQSQSMMQSLRKLGVGAVALYTVVTNDKGWVILTTPDFRRAYPIDTTGLNQTISDFRLTLKSDRFDPAPLAQKIYAALFLQKNDEGATLAGDLRSYRARTLMWSLDGVLRYIPVGALHDGKGYLMERYPNLVFTTASLTRLLDAAEGKWRGFGLGVSREHKEFKALPAVRRELRAIIREAGAAQSRGVLPGVIRLDEQFTHKALIDGLRDGYPVVHIASHFRFNAEREEASFLLLGDGSYLSLEEMQNSPGIFERVELLTLSACDTATTGANGKEVEGLAFVAQDLGAKAVVASLWPVADEGTEVLMREFYRLKQENPRWSKAEALRQAQMLLLRGKVSSSGQGPPGKRGPTVNEAERGLRTYKGDTKAPFAHPHYWAPFILIGNWK